MRAMLLLLDPRVGADRGEGVVQRQSRAGEPQSASAALHRHSLLQRRGAWRPVHLILMLRWEMAALLHVAVRPLQSSNHQRLRRTPLQCSSLASPFAFAMAPPLLLCLQSRVALLLRRASLLIKKGAEEGSALCVSSTKEALLLPFHALLHRPALP